MGLDMYLTTASGGELGYWRKPLASFPSHWTTLRRGCASQDFPFPFMSTKTEAITYRDDLLGQFQTDLRNVLQKQFNALYHANLAVFEKDHSQGHDTTKAQMFQLLLDRLQEVALNTGVYRY